MVARTAFAVHLPARSCPGDAGRGVSKRFARQPHICASACNCATFCSAVASPRRGLLDRPAIETYLGRDPAEGSFDYFRLIEIADVERWARAVEARSAGSA